MRNNNNMTSHDLALTVDHDGTIIRNDNNDGTMIQNMSHIPYSSVNNMNDPSKQQSGTTLQFVQDQLK